MKEVAAEISSWLDNGQETIALATVIKTWGSAPRRPGAKLAIDIDDNIAGSVSGGCVEGAVIEASRSTLETGKAQYLHFGVADETAWGVGLACGGSIDILVEKLNLPFFEATCGILNRVERGSVSTIVKGADDLVGKKLIVSGGDELVCDMPFEVRARVLSVVADSVVSQAVALDAETVVFVDLLQPPPTLVVVGGVDIAIALTKMASLAGYDTVVVDPRRVFGADSRFPHVNRLIQKWPRSAFAEIDLNSDTAVALLTHDPKIDDPALKVVLPSDVFYIGALGSRKTHASRLKRLAGMGFTSEQTDRIFAPIGLDIGAESPQEIALSVMAEIVGARRGRAQARTG